MTEEEELREAFPEEIGYNPNNPEHHEQPSLSELENRISNLELFAQGYLNKTNEKVDKENSKIKQAIAQIVIAGGESKDG